MAYNLLKVSTVIIYNTIIPQRKLGILLTLTKPSFVGKYSPSNLSTKPA
jgi:hypothetical protein